VEVDLQHVVKKKESNLLPTVSCGLFSRPICEFNCCNSWSN
jgi:hypothetical protein